MKVLTLVGTRPELIKLSKVLSILDENLDHTFVHTGQNYDWELNGIFYEELGIRKPDYYLNVVEDTLSKTVAKIICSSDDLLEKIIPDAFLILGDTNSCLSAYSAKRKQIPIFHMEAGNRCFDQRVPEEINRKIIDHISDINMPYTEHARRNLLQENFPEDQIVKTGSPMMEILDANKEHIESSSIISEMNVAKGEYIVLSIHREENVDDPIRLNRIISLLNNVIQVSGMPIIFSCHPRTEKKLNRLNCRFDEKFILVRPLGFFDYCSLQKNSYCTISDSGTLTEESSILGFPAVTLRQAHERPEGMDFGTIGMSDGKFLLDAIQFKRNQFQSNCSPEIVSDYDVKKVSWKVVNTILSYTEYINRKIWKRK